MNLEEMRDAAKRITASGVNAVSSGDMAVFAYDFAKTAASGTVGVKRTGLIIPKNTLIESGVMRVNTATTGAFNLQLVAAADLLAATEASAEGTLGSLIRVHSGNVDREVLINVTTAFTAGKVIAWLRLLPT